MGAVGRPKIVARVWILTQHLGGASWEGGVRHRSGYMYAARVLAHQSIIASNAFLIVRVLICHCRPVLLLLLQCAYITTLVDLLFN